MSEIAVVCLTETEGGSASALADSFIASAKEKGHSVLGITSAPEKHCRCGGGCCQKGGEGCGNEDCLCTFAESVPGCDAIVFVFAVDRGFVPSALNRTVHKITFDCVKNNGNDRKKVFAVITSESFDEYVFNDAVSVIRMECTLKDWDYAGEVLVPGLPDSCIGADPVSRRKAAELAGKI